VTGFPGSTTTIQALVDGGPAQEAGLQVGDKVISVESKKLYGERHLERILIGSDTNLVKVTVVRDGEKITG